MAAANAIPDDQIVYRGLRNSNWCKGTVVNYRAFMLRLGSDAYPPEAELSVGLTPESAVSQLNEQHGTAALSVLSIHALPYNLRVLADPTGPTKACIHGAPLYSTDRAQRDLAVTVATDLAGISWFVPVQPS